jgi:hypothetical protein
MTEKFSADVSPGKTTKIVRDYTERNDPNSPLYGQRR